MFNVDDSSPNFRPERLEIALERALDWQNNHVDDEQVRVNRHTYYGPHKWIVCLIGSDKYQINTFMNKHKESL